MREIKFRAWEQNEKHMIPNVESGVYEDPDEVFDFDTVLSLERFVVMQYTGLKDKNGQEIYEGDIFENAREDAHELVTFDEGSFWLEGSTYTSPLHEVDTSSKEVIGNIYEHVHLLEEATT